MIFDKINSFSRIPQIAQIFNTESTEFFHREHKDCILCLSFRRNIKESYDFDKINSFSLIPQISQIFNTESTEFFHREHKDWILCLSFRRNLKEFMILVNLKVSRGLG